MRIVWVSDLSIIGSGYRNLSIPVLDALSKNHDVKVIGLKYGGEEHWHDFSIIGAEDMRQVFAQLNNMVQQWTFDCMFVALDIPFHVQIFLPNLSRREYKYYAITPVEAPPLTISWAIGLGGADKVFCISKFGTKLLEDAGIPSEYFEIGVDVESWKRPDDETRETFRRGYGISNSTDVILMVADNQERKFISRAFEIYRDYLENTGNKDSRFILITREHLEVGWKLRDLAGEFGFMENLMIVERGLSFKELWKYYAMADVFLLTSKAEGLGMPVLEAMAMRIPCIGVNHTGMAEVLADNRGYLIEHDYTIRDPFGNGIRYYANIEDGARKLEQALSGHKEIDLDAAWEYVRDREWQNAVGVIEKTLKELHPIPEAS